MSTYTRARDIIIETLPDCEGKPADRVAKLILDALMEHRIRVQAMRASRDMFVRFHAHVAHLGKASGWGYREVYAGAVAYAEERDEWPCKLIPRTVNVSGTDVTVDVRVPESTTRATNRQLLCAYEYVTMTAQELGVALPEHTDDDEDA